MEEHKKFFRSSSELFSSSKKLLSIYFASSSPDARTGKVKFESRLNDIKKIFSFILWTTSRGASEQEANKVIFHIFICFSFIWLAFSAQRSFHGEGWWLKNDLFVFFSSAHGLVTDYIREGNRKLMFKADGRQGWIFELSSKAVSSALMKSFENIRCLWSHSYTKT